MRSLRRLKHYFIYIVFGRFIKHTLLKIKNKSIRGLIISLCVVLFVILIVKNLGFIQDGELAFRNVLHLVKHTQMTTHKINKKASIHFHKIGKSPNIHVIKMDNHSFLKYGQMPWKRDAYTVPLKKFSKGQLTVALNWINDKFQPGKKQHYRVYYSHKPIKNSIDLEKATLLQDTTSFEPQIYLNFMLFKPGKYYFAITQIDAQKSENRAIKVGYNTTEIPITIKIRPALRAQSRQWQQEYQKKRKPAKLPKIEKKYSNHKKIAISTLRSAIHYPSAIFYDVFFLDYKGKNQDQALIESLRRNSNVFVDYFLASNKQTAYPDLQQRLRNIQKFSFPASKTYKENPYLFAKSVELPIPEIINAVEGTGFATPRLDRDNYTRRWQLVVQFPSKKYPNRFYPSAPLLLAMHHFHVPLSNVEIQLGKHVILKKAAIKTEDKKSGRLFYRYQDIKIPINEYGMMVINYAGSPGLFLEYPNDKNNLSSFASLQQYNPNTLSDNIYMIGVFEEGVQSKDRTTDFRQTPMGEMFGIEIMANALNTIVTRNFVYIVDDIWNALLLLAIACFMGIMLPRCSIFISGLIAFGFFIAFIVSSYFLYQSNLIIDNMGPMFSIFFVFLSLTIFKTVTEEKEKKEIKNQFGKLVNKEVVDELLQNPEKLRLGGERRELTVLFSDIRRFTSISEGMEAEELVLFLNEYLNKMTDIVLDNLGTLDKYVGDEIMAFWGAPLPQPEHAYLACVTAVSMMDKLNELNNNWPPHKQLNIGIGINTGEMLVGYMGSERRMDYTIIGDCVNLGARLESANKFYRTNIIINQSTYECVKDRVVARELDLVRVKGKHQPVRIYELIHIND